MCPRDSSESTEAFPVLCSCLDAAGVLGPTESCPPWSPIPKGPLPHGQPSLEIPGKAIGQWAAPWWGGAEAQVEPHLPPPQPRDPALSTPLQGTCSLLPRPHLPSNLAREQGRACFGSGVGLRAAPESCPRPARGRPQASLRGQSSAQQDRAGLLPAPAEMLVACGLERVPENVWNPECGRGGPAGGEWDETLQMLAFSKKLAPAPGVSSQQLSAPGTKTCHVGRCFTWHSALRVQWGPGAGAQLLE